MKRWRKNASTKALCSCAHKHKTRCEERKRDTRRRRTWQEGKVLSDNQVRRIMISRDDMNEMICTDHFVWWWYCQNVLSKLFFFSLFRSINRRRTKKRTRSVNLSSLSKGYFLMKIRLLLEKNGREEKRRYFSFFFSFSFFFFFFLFFSLSSSFSSLSVLLWVLDREDSIGERPRLLLTICLRWHVSIEKQRSNERRKEKKDKSISVWFFFLEMVNENELMKLSV